MASATPTYAELNSLSSACNKLWELDTNRLEPNVHYELNLQEGKTAYARGDAAHERLFTYVDPCVFERRTYKVLFDLLDNYERETGVTERVTPKELVENNAFLNAVIDTAPMRYAHAWLVTNKKFMGNMQQFRKQLEFIWFGLYRREIRNDSSGFEHVFVGEEKNGKICGCHNWLQVYNEERRGRIDYRGYIRPKQRGCRFMEPHNKEQLITIQFQWDSEIKLVSTSLLGVSPEFEMALYTMCFLNGEENNHVQLGPYLANIKCFPFGRGNDTRVGTAFPEALPLTEAQAATKIQAILRGNHTRFQTPHVRRQARPPPPGTAWGPPLGVATTQPALSTGNAWSKPLKKKVASAAPTGVHLALTGAWTQPPKRFYSAPPLIPELDLGDGFATEELIQKCPSSSSSFLKALKETAMEAKGKDDRNSTKLEASSKANDDLETDESGAPNSEVVALRDGYNQTYIIRSSKNTLHEVLFRCGNWCYSGKVDLGNAELKLGDLPVVIPALQKQQASLQYLCEWKALPSTSQYFLPLETLYDVFDFIGAELSSERIEHKLIEAAAKHTWVDKDDDGIVNTFFELQSGSYECFDDVDIVASKTFVRGLMLVVIFYQSSFYVVLQAADGEQPLLDVRLPDLSAHLQGIPLQTYHSDECSNMKKLTLWQAANVGKHQSVPKPLKVQCTDVSGTDYNQTFLIRRSPRVEGSTNSSNLREVLFRFGNWCYNGHVDLGPALELSDIPVIIPMLRRHQSALTFMCEASKMPTTSLFTPCMEHLAEIVPAIQKEMANVEQYVQTLAQTRGSLVNKTGHARSWLEDDDVECFFEIAMSNCLAFQDVEAIASKIHVGGVVLVLLYYNYTFYVFLANGEEEHALLDTNFPDVSLQNDGLQLKTYRNGIRNFKELRRISLWKVENELASEEDDEHDAAAVDCITARTKSLLFADSKVEHRREEAAESDAKSAKDWQSRKAALPHHVAPLSGAAAGTNLGSMPDHGLKAPWDDTGKPLGLQVSK